MIKANFNAYDSYVTDSLYQWDKDQTLRVSGVNISVAPEIHFTNNEMDRAIVRQGVLKDGIISVDIPNSLLQSIQDIKAYIGVWEGSTFKTIETVVIPVVMRDRPEDYVLENKDEEYYSFSKLENAIANMVTLAGFNAQVAKTEADILAKENALKAQISNIITHNNDTDGNTELVDIRTGADGKVYGSAGEAVRRQINGINEELDYVVTDEKSVNLLNPDFIVKGHFIKVIKGTSTIDTVEYIEDSRYDCAIIPVEEFTDYTITGTGYATYVIRKDNGLVGPTSFSSGTTNFKLSEFPTYAVSHILVSWRNDVYPNGFMFVKGNTLPSEYVPFYEYKKLQNVVVPHNLVSNKVKLYNVGKNGDFTTLTSALKVLKDDDSEKVIYVESGTYDLYEEMGGDTFIKSIPNGETNYRDYDTVVPPNTSIIGVGSVTLLFNLPDTTPEFVTSLLSPISVNNGNFRLENVNIICTNCRYGIHDQSTQDGNVTHIYKNVRIVKDSEKKATGKIASFGCGFNDGSKFEFDSCIFESNYRPFSFHNSTGGNGSIIVKNCVFNMMKSGSSSYKTIKFGNVGGKQAHINVMLSNCYFNNGISIQGESSNDVPNSYDVTVLNCSGDKNIVVSTTTANIYPPKIFE